MGFFQITGYGAAPGQAEELLALIKRFFDLPLEERMKLDNRLSPHFRGYTRMGTEVTQGRADAREQIDYSPSGNPSTTTRLTSPTGCCRATTSGRTRPCRSSSPPPWPGQN